MAELIQNSFLINLCQRSSSAEENENENTRTKEEEEEREKKREEEVTRQGQDLRRCQFHFHVAVHCVANQIHRQESGRLDDCMTQKEPCLIRANWQLMAISRMYVCLRQIGLLQNVCCFPRDCPASVHW